VRVVATTVVRESVFGKQRTGYIYDVDWAAQRVERRLPVPDPSFPQADDNPRGGVRGGRGVAVTRGGIIVANCDTLYRYDDSWNVVDSLSNPLFVGMHEIDWDGQHLWIAATGLDAVLKTTLEGHVEVAWDPHADETLDRFALMPRPHPIDGSVDYRKREAPLLDQCHLNGVVRRDGDLIVNCGLVRQRRPLVARTVRRVRAKLGVEDRGAWAKRLGRSLILRVNATSNAKLLLEMELHAFPTHNGQLIDESLLIVNDSRDNTLRVYDLVDGSPRERPQLTIPGTWLRGLEPTGDGRVLVGSAPASLMLVDVRKGVVEGSIELSSDANEAVHGLAVVPPLDERI
jgi:hypothetical protein